MVLAGRSLGPFFRKRTSEYTTILIGTSVVIELGCYEIGNGFGGQQNKLQRTACFSWAR